ncbi:MAG: uppS, partial [Bacteroidetes bacterium]|nr:uppS [Bacteroidota bacterium]
MDGNGRWAKKRGMPRIAGHSEGVESVRDIVEACGQLGVKYLTLYAFSTENWKRPQEEVSLLMRLLVKALRDETDRLHSSNVRLKAIGQIAKLPREVQAELLEGIEKT